ncbi:hypothetical protein [Floccifex sp.]|uniref:hypothetical protein n=1 Tax=Floccifex sp. TaxID=2815810 RepID=UPI003F0AB351
MTGYTNLYLQLIFLIQELNYAYFLIHFFDSENKKRDFFIILFMYHFVFDPIAYEFQNNIVLKFIWGSFSLLSIWFLYHKNCTVFKVITSYIIMVVVMSFTELILLGFMHLINFDLSHIDMLNYPLYLYGIQGVLYFILFTLSLKIFSKRYLIYLKENLFLIFLYINQAIISYFAAGCLLYLTDATYIIYILLIQMLLFLFQLCLLIMLYKRSLAKQKERTMWMLEKEYEKQLKTYIDIRGNQEEYRMLRHDILNFLLVNRGKYE